MLVRALKLLLGVFLLPACVAATLVLKREVFGVLKTELYFFAGLFTYLILLAIFQQPIRTYIFGHELTHVLWVWIFGGRVRGFKASAAKGQVRASKSNFLIFLAPYFFPLYSILAIALYLGLQYFFPLPSGLKILGFVLGFTWAFHITFTVYVLIQGQPDVWATGRVFSLPFIYVANVVVLACLIIFSSPELSYRQFFSTLWKGVRDSYLQIWHAAPGFYDLCRVRLEDWISRVGLRG